MSASSYLPAPLEEATIKIEDQVIAITGASAGMGAATARLLAGKGARVVLGARRQDTLARIVAEIQASGVRAASRAVDVTRQRTCASSLRSPLIGSVASTLSYRTPGSPPSPRLPTGASPIGTG